MKSHLAALALFTLLLAAHPFDALAEDQALQTQFHAAAGGGNWGTNYSAGWGTAVDVLEISALNLGQVGTNGYARFAGISLVQNATPIRGFNFLFRIGIGRETTTFANGITAHRMWFGNGLFVGLGEQYQVNPHFALRAEVYRIPYAASPDGQMTGIRYPATLSAMYTF